MVKNDELVRERDVGGEIIPDGVNNPARREVASRIILAANDENAGVMSADLHDKVVKNPEVVLVARGTRATSRRYVCQMHGVIFTGKTNVQGDLYVMTVAPEQLHQL